MGSEIKNSEPKKKSFPDIVKGLGSAFRHNVKTIVLSLIVAVIVWFVVSVQVFPTIETSISGIPILAQPTEYMLNHDLEITGSYAAADIKLDDGKKYELNVGTTDIRIEGKRYDISDLRAEDFYAELDLSTVRSAGTFTVPVSIFSRTGVDYNLLETSQLAVTLVVDEIITREYPITAYAPDITLPDGYYVDEVTASPATVTIIGSSSVLDKISRVEAKATFDGEIKESHEVQTELAVYTASGSRLVNDDIKMSADSVLVNIPIYMQKELPLTFSFTGIPQYFDINSLGYDIQPSSIMVAAPDDSISNLSELNVGTINIADIRLNQTTSTIPITLPDGYKNLSGNNSARITWDIADYGKLDFQATHIAAVNIPDNMEVEIITQVLTLSAIGPSEQLSTLTSDSFYIVANLLGVSLHDGSQDVPVSVMITSSGSQKCWVLGTYKITVSARTLTNNEG